MQDIKSLKNIDLVSERQAPSITLHSDTWAVGDTIYNKQYHKSMERIHGVQMTVINVADKQIRDKLIAMGWTPPPNK